MIALLDRMAGFQISHFDCLGSPHPYKWGGVTAVPLVAPGLLEGGRRDQGD